MAVSPYLRGLGGAIVTAVALGALGPLGLTHVMARTSTQGATDAVTPARRVPVVYPVVLTEIPRDPVASLGGLQLAGGMLYEVAGGPDHSELRELDPTSGVLRRGASLPDGLSGTGIAVVGDRIWQLTGRDGIVLEWDRGSMTLRRSRPLAGYGWGLCHDGTRLIRSDGTGRLYLHDAETFAPVGAVTVTLQGSAVSHLDELECVAGSVYATVRWTHRILRLDPATGTVTAVVDTTGLIADPAVGPDDVLGGITHLGGEEFLLTGARWPVVARVRLTPSD